MIRTKQFTRFAQIAEELITLYRDGCELSQTYPLLRRWQEILDGMSAADRLEQPWIVLDIPAKSGSSITLHTYHPTKADWNFYVEWMPGELSPSDEQEIRNHLIEMMGAWLRVDRLLTTDAPVLPQVTGVSLADVGLALNYCDQELTEFVARFSKSKKITASPIGKDPKDGRAKLYELFEILKNLNSFSPLGPTEKQRILKHLLSVQRAPKAS